MKRWGDSKAFIPLISVIFILFAAMVMTGCAHTALVTAAHNGQTDVVKDLLDKGADPNERGNCGTFRGGWSVTPLCCAVYGGHMEAVKVLVDRGADVNGLSSRGNTALAEAIHMGHTDIAKLLIERGADVEYDMARYKESRQLDRYKLLESLSKKQQSPRYQASPQTLPTALPLPTEPAAPF